MICVCPIRRNRNHELIVYLHCTVYRSVSLGQGHNPLFRAFEGTKQDLILLIFQTMSFHIKKQTKHFVKQICSQPLEKKWEGIHLNRHSNRFLTKDKISWDYTECSLCVDHEAHMQLIQIDMVTKGIHYLVIWCTMMILLSL